MDVAIMGIGLHPFGRHPGKSGVDLGEYAVREALADAGINWTDIDASFGGGMESKASDGILPRLGLTGKPFTNVFTGCATAGSSLASAVSSVKSGESEIALAFGFDKHPRGMFGIQPSALGLDEWYGEIGLMPTVQFFAMKFRRYMHDHGISEQALTKVAEKNFYNGSITPHAWRKNSFTSEEISGSRMICEPFTQYMLCSPSEGGAAIIVCRADQASKYTKKPIYVKAVKTSTRPFGSFEIWQASTPLDEAKTTVQVAAERAFEEAGVSPKDIQIAQLQDSESGHEIMHMAETGLCEHGEQEFLINNGDTKINGKLPINTDGGLMANGEPVGASGLRQIYEVCTQLRGDAGDRQVPGDPKLGLTQVYGAPGLSSVSILQR